MEELTALAAQEGIEMPDEILDIVAGGFGGISPALMLIQMQTALESADDPAACFKELRAAAKSPSGC